MYILHKDLKLVSIQCVVRCQHLALLIMHAQCASTLDVPTRVIGKLGYKPSNELVLMEEEAGVVRSAETPHS